MQGYVYFLKCTDRRDGKPRGIIYIGMTERKLGERMAEHFAGRGCVTTRKYKTHSLLAAFLTAHPLAWENCKHECRPALLKWMETTRGGPPLTLAMTTHVAKWIGRLGDVRWLTSTELKEAEP